MLAKKLLEKTNQRVEKVEQAIQEHAKKVQQIEENLAKGYAGEHPERYARRRKTMDEWMGRLGSKDGRQ